MLSLSQEPGPPPRGAGARIVATIVVAALAAYSTLRYEIADAAVVFNAFALVGLGVTVVIAIRCRPVTPPGKTAQVLLAIPTLLFPIGPVMDLILGSGGHPSATAMVWQGTGALGTLLAPLVTWALLAAGRAGEGPQFFTAALASFFLTLTVLVMPVALFLTMVVWHG